MSRIRRVLEANFEQAKKSGSGYELFRPLEPKDFKDVPVESPSEVLFEDVDKIMARIKAADNNAVLIFGEPGSGKSHLRDDLTMAKAALHSVPYLAVTLHINGANNRGPGNAKDVLDRLRAVGDDQKLVVFDNVDYLGYKGHRTRTQARDYALRMGEIIAETVSDEEFAVVGTAHDDSWRAGRWAWYDDTIDVPAVEALGIFPETYLFEGKLTDYGLREIAISRGLGEDFISLLAKNSMQTFFHAQHLDLDMHDGNLEAAQAAIKDSREQRKHSR